MLPAFSFGKSVPLPKSVVVAGVRADGFAPIPNFASLRGIPLAKF
jgi:hypothetical protein